MSGKSKKHMDEDFKNLKRRKIKEFMELARKLPPGAERDRVLKNVEAQELQLKRANGFEK